MTGADGLSESRFFPLVDRIFAIYAVFARVTVQGSGFEAESKHRSEVGANE